MDGESSLTACQEVQISEVESSGVGAMFLQQPPEELRKSNFFKFTVQLFRQNEPICVKAAKFIKFLHEESDKDIRNGILYRIGFTKSSKDVHFTGALATEVMPQQIPGLQPEELEWRDLYLTIVDASTSEPIRYEGHDQNPTMKRVLLTHESICMRCAEHRMCGNRSEAPADPRITTGGALQFFMKCNQNCLKGAGNPRDMRRFALALSTEDIMCNKNTIIALSNRIFVHNNSKHSRKRSRKDFERKESLPLVDPDENMYVFPKIGMLGSSFMFHSRVWSKHGVTFRCSGVELTKTSLNPGEAMILRIPPTIRPGKVLITLLFNGSPVFSFQYEIHSMLQSDPRITAGGFLFLRSGEDPNRFGVYDGSENLVTYLIDGMPFDSCYYQPNNYGPISYNYARHPNYYQSSSSVSSSASSVSPRTSSDSPNSGSHVSGESPPDYMRHGF